MRKILQKYKLPKKVLKLEFSEKIFLNLPKVEQEKRLTNIIRSLQKLGFIISTDDFGESYEEVDTCTVTFIVSEVYYNVTNSLFGAKIMLLIHMHW